jgi:ABC-2 type transport system permease protein
MKLVFIHARATTVELLRHPAYVVPTLAFPTVFFIFFSGANYNADTRMATFAAFAAIGVAFFQFGVGIATERVSPWERYLRTLPVPPLARLLARTLSAAFFATGAAAIVIVVAVATTSAALTPDGWVELVAILAAGTVPFALLGTALGYWTPVRGALPIANLLYLGLAYAGGLWFPPDRLPGFVGRLSEFLPTRALENVLAAAATERSVPWTSCGALAAYSLLFAVIALAGYRRDEGFRYR